MLSIPCMDAMHDASVSHSAEAALKGLDDLCNTSLKPRSLMLMVLTFSASLCQQKPHPQPSEGERPGRRACAARWWITGTGILHGDLYWTPTASMLRVDRAALSTLSIGPLMEINTAGFQYSVCLDSAFKSLSRSLKVRETFSRCGKNQVNLSHCIDFKRLSRRVDMHLIKPLASAKFRR